MSNIIPPKKITKVIIRNFKRFGEIEFQLPGEQVVIAGPNNRGKTTLLQAIATWHLAAKQWAEKGDHILYGGKGYGRVPISRQSLFSVPVHNFNMLWHGGKGRKNNPMEIDVYIDGSSHPMELIYDSTEQIYIRPSSRHEALFSAFALDDLRPNIIFIPSMTGLTLTEPLYQQAKVDEILGQGRSGEVLRNVLVKIHQNQIHWDKLCKEIEALFGYELLPPDSSGANIIAEYRDGKIRLDIAAAGSGFLQSLMLFAFLVSQEKSVLLLDEPDAHLHILLQDRVFTRLKEFARLSDSMLIIATHSERVINAVEPHHLCVLLDKPTPIISPEQRRDIITALRTIDNTDIMLAKNAPGILYVEGRTDIDILRKWAAVLGHRLSDFLEQPYWRPTVTDVQGGGIQSADHYRALCLACPDLAAVELKDSDGREKNTSLEITESGIARFHWRRYEIESYLLIPKRIAAYVFHLTGQEDAKDKAFVCVRDCMTPAAFREPMGDDGFFKSIKAKDIIHMALQEGGISPSDGIVDLSDIAAMMTREEIHPEVIAKLDAIADHFDIKEESSKTL